MAWTYPALKAAYQALSPAPASDDAAAVALNAQTDASAQDVLTHDVKVYLLETGEWGKIQAAATSSGTSATLLPVVLNFLETIGSLSFFGTSDATVLASVQSGLSAFATAGLISAGTQSALLAMVTAARPVWQPAVTAGDVYAARTFY